MLLPLYCPLRRTPPLTSTHTPHTPHTSTLLNPQAKEMVENAPIVVKAGLKKEEAEKLMQVLADVGAKAELI
jgi:hypothetical protein